MHISARVRSQILKTCEVISSAFSIMQTVRHPTPINVALAIISTTALATRTLSPTDPHFNDIDTGVDELLFSTMKDADLLRNLGKPGEDDKRGYEIWEYKEDVRLVFKVYHSEVWMGTAEWAASGGVRGLAREVIWKHLGNSLVCSKTRTTVADDFDIVADTCTTAPSPLADSIVEGVQKHIEAGHTRGLALYGPAGTGKTWLGRAIGQKIGGRVLRVAANTEIGGTMMRLLTFLRPDMLVLDDVDRVSNSALVSDFERLRLTCKVVLLIFNDKSKIDTALLRPGRLDDVYYIDELPDASFKSLSVGFSEDLRLKIRGWPAAYINELQLKQSVGADVIEAYEALRSRLPATSANSGK